MVTVQLSKEYTVGGSRFSEVVLREPTYADIFMSGLGEPAEWQPIGAGGMGRIVYPERVDAYLQRLVKEPGYELIAVLSSRDALKLRDEVLGFFRPKADT